MNAIGTDSEPAGRADNPVGEAFWAADVHVPRADVGDQPAKQAGIETHPMAASDQDMQASTSSLHEGGDLVVEEHFLSCWRAQHDYDVN